MIKILFTGGGGAGNEALWRLLGDHYTLHFGDADSSAIDPCIPQDRRHQLPWASDPDFVEKMADLCRRLGIDLLVPGVDEELLALARNANVLAPTRLMLPHADYVETMLDKLHMIRSLSEKEIPVPFSRTLVDDLKDIHFPCISKPRSGRGSRDVRVLNSIADAMSLKSTLGDAAEKILVQDKIEGVEYTVQMVADDSGRLRAIVPVRVGIKRGITIRAETEAEPQVVAACRAIHQAIPTAGCYNIQLMLTAEGAVLPFEINPRISTTFCLAVAAGIDPVAIFLEQDRNDSILPFVAGIQLRRHWTNLFSKEQTNGA
jgi:carbamoyl-phosphate synthase large subunit